MMSKASLSNFHPSLNLFRYTVRRNLGLTALVSIFMLLICPGYILMYIQNQLKMTESTVFDLNKALPTLIFSVTVVTTAVAMLFLFINFTFLYAKNASDLFHSLPLNRRGLLFSRFFSSVTPLLIPITLVYASMCGLIAFPKVNGDIKTVILGFIFNLLIMLMCSAFTLIFIICAGSIFDLIISFLSINIGVILSVLVASDIARSFLKGYTDESVVGLLKFSSPYFFSFAGFTGLLDNNFRIGSGTIIFTLKLLFLTGIMLTVSFLLYNRRKSEKSGVSYAYRFIYILSTLIVGYFAAFALGGIFSNGEYNVFFWIFAAIGGVLAAITFGAINDRGFKTVKKSAITGGCSVAILALTTVIMLTGCFGFTERIPRKSSVKAVTVEFDGCSVEFTDTDLASNLHKELIADSDYDGENGGGITLHYSLTRGRTVNRYFFVNYSEHLDSMLEIYKSKENIESIRKNLNDFKGKSLTISQYLADGKDEDMVSDVVITYPEFKSVVDAFCKDVQFAGEKSIIHENTDQYTFGAIDENHKYRSFSIYIEDGFSETKSIIDSLNLKGRMVMKDYY